jgi:hypothetical protein
MSRYSFPEPLVQQIVNVLSQLPFAQSGAIINGMAQECQQQDAERAEQQLQQVRDEARAALLAEQSATAEPPAAA